MPETTISGSCVLVPVDQAELEALHKLRDAVKPLFDPHGPRCFSPEWDKAWKDAQAALSDLEGE